MLVGAMHMAVKSAKLAALPGPPKALPQRFKQWDRQAVAVESVCPPQTIPEKGILDVQVQTLFFGLHREYGNHPISNKYIILCLN